MTTPAVQFHFENYPLDLSHRPTAAQSTPGPAGRGALVGMATGAVTVVATIPPMLVAEPEEWVPGAVLVMIYMVAAAAMAAGPGAAIGFLLGNLNRAPVGVQRAVGALAAVVCATPALLLLGLLSWPVAVITMLCGLGAARWVAVGPRQELA